MPYNNLFKLLLLLIFFCGVLKKAHGQDTILSQKVNIAFENLTIKEVFKKLEETTDADIAYNSEFLDNSKFSMSFKNKALHEILDSILSSKGLSYAVVGNTITVYKKNNKANESGIKTKSNNYTLSGFVYDKSNKEVLIGATI